jgi:hypothetical protein
MRVTSDSAIIVAVLGSSLRRAISQNISPVVSLAVGFPSIEIFTSPSSMIYPVLFEKSPCCIMVSHEIKVSLLALPSISCMVFSLTPANIVSFFTFSLPNNFIVIFLNK